MRPLASAPQTLSSAPPVVQTHGQCQDWIFTMLRKTSPKSNVLGNNWACSYITTCSLERILLFWKETQSSFSTRQQQKESKWHRKPLRASVEIAIRQSTRWPNHVAPCPGRRAELTMWQTDRRDVLVFTGPAVYLHRNNIFSVAHKSTGNSITSSPFWRKAWYKPLKTKFTDHDITAGKIWIYGE